LIGLATVALPVRAAPVGAVDGAPCIAFDALGYRYIAFGRTGITESGIYLATNRSGAWRVSPHPVTSGKRCAEINGRGCLSDSTFSIGNGDHAPHVLAESS